MSLTEVVRWALTGRGPAPGRRDYIRVDSTRHTPYTWAEQQCPCGAPVQIGPAGPRDEFCSEDCRPSGSIGYDPGPSAARWRPELESPPEPELEMIYAWTLDDGLTLTVLLSPDARVYAHGRVAVQVRVEDGERYVGQRRAMPQDRLGDEQFVRVEAMRVAPVLIAELANPSSVDHQRHSPRRQPDEGYARDEFHVQVVATPSASAQRQVQEAIDTLRRLDEAVARQPYRLDGTEIGWTNEDGITFTRLFD